MQLDHITCDSAGAVTSFTIWFVLLTLPLPAGLCAALPSLFVLVVSDANLSGFIPPDLSSNSLSAPIPPSSPASRLCTPLSLTPTSSLARSPRRSALPPPSDNSSSMTTDSPNLSRTPSATSGLESLWADGNYNLSSPIPASLSRSANLSVLDLTDTKISSSIPASLGQLSNLQTLSIHTAMLSRSIPLKLDNCSSLVTSSSTRTLSLALCRPPSTGSLDSNAFSYGRTRSPDPSLTPSAISRRWCPSTSPSTRSLTQFWPPSTSSMASRISCSTTITSPA